MSVLAACGTSASVVASAPGDAAPPHDTPPTASSGAWPSHQPQAGDRAASSVQCFGADVLNVGGMLNPLAFDRPDAPRNPHAALKRQLDRAKMARDQSTRRLIDFDYSRGPAQEDPDRVIFVGLRSDRTVGAVISVRTGGTAHRWLPAGFDICDPLPTPAG
jgi:hypothetical protein